MPYRTNKDRRRVEPETVGMVADMVRQFADPYAFLRELVQNAIDAGASAIDVRFELKEDGQAALSVRDDGSGMTREIIEGPLLTLFSSSKENVAGKIGKYGVGFVSVFAIEPDEVRVASWRHEGSWELSLWCDHRYELAEAAPRKGSGTEVTLLKSTTPEAFEDHVSRGRTALVRWCRHASVPIALVVRRPVAPADEEKIDRALSVPATVCVLHQAGSERFVVAPSAGAEAPAADSGWLEEHKSFAGFYNHGLTLYETDQPPRRSLEGVRFKVDSPHLSHTLSRDNVRHDEAYERALDEVERLAGEPLGQEVERALGAAAAAAAEGQRVEVYVGLLRAACERPVRMAVERIGVPLCHPIAADADKVCAAADIVSGGLVRCAAAPNAVTRALALAHTPVLRAEHDGVVEALQARLGGRFVSVTSQFSCIEELGKGELSRSDRALVRETRLLLEAAGARLSSLALARAEVEVDGVERAAVRGSSSAEGAAHLVALDESMAWWSRWRSASVLLMASHEAVTRARSLAERDPLVAAQLLARYLVVEQRGEIAAGSSDAMLQRTLTRLAGRRRPR